MAQRYPQTRNVLEYANYVNERSMLISKPRRVPDASLMIIMLIGLAFLKIIARKLFDVIWFNR